MIRLTFLVSFTILTSTYAHATQCNADLIKVLSWKIAPVDAQNNRLTLVLTWNGAKSVQMLDASVRFRDILGGRIASMALERDIKQAPGSNWTTSSAWGPFTFERLLKLQASQVETSTCVRAVQYDDGTIERFDK